MNVNPSKMDAHVLANQDVSHLNHLIVDDVLQIKSAEFYQKIPQEQLSIWAHHNGIYGLITTELIEWLREEIGDMHAIEIGAGNGCIGKELEIMCTDAKLMENPEVRANYLLMGQPVTAYPKHVKKFTAENAIERYNPEVVIGSWITHKYDAADHARGGNMYGVDEEKLLRKVKKYIMIGNRHTHRLKPILDREHKEFQTDWIYSRSVHSDDNVIFIWER